MKTYKVTIREVFEQDVMVQAVSEADAILRVSDGEGEYDDPPRYVETLDPESWSIRLMDYEEKENE